MMMILRIMLCLLLGNLVTSLYHGMILHTLLLNTGMCSYCPVIARAFSMKIVLSHVRESIDESTEDLPWFDQNLTQHPLQCNCRKAVAFVKAIPRVTGSLSKQILVLLLLNDLLYQKQHPHEGTSKSLATESFVYGSQVPEISVLSFFGLDIESISFNNRDRRGTQDTLCMRTHWQTFLFAIWDHSTGRTAFTSIRYVEGGPHQRHCPCCPSGKCLPTSSLYMKLLDLCSR